jgi:hypothetical protein
MFDERNRATDGCARAEHGQTPRGDSRREEIANKLTALCLRLGSAAKLNLRFYRAQWSSSWSFFLSSDEIANMTRHESKEYRKIKFQGRAIVLDS